MAEHSILSAFSLRTGLPYVFGRAHFRTHSDPKQNLVKRNTRLLAIQNKGSGSTQLLSCRFLITLKINSFGNSATLLIPMPCSRKRLISTLVMVGRELCTTLVIHSFILLFSIFHLAGTYFLFSPGHQAALHKNLPLL